MSTELERLKQRVAGLKSQFAEQESRRARRELPQRLEAQLLARGVDANSARLRAGLTARRLDAKFGPDAGDAEGQPIPKFRTTPAKVSWVPGESGRVLPDAEAAWEAARAADLPRDQAARMLAALTRTAVRLFAIPVNTAQAFVQRMRPELTSKAAGRSAPQAQRFADGARPAKFNPNDAGESQMRLIERNVDPTTCLDTYADSAVVQRVVKDVR